MRVAPSGICLAASLSPQCCAVITRKLINSVALHLLTGGNGLLDLTRALCALKCKQLMSHAFVLEFQNVCGGFVNPPFIQALIIFPLKNMCGVSTANIQIFLTQLGRISAALSKHQLLFVATLGKADEGTS